MAATSPQCQLAIPPEEINVFNELVPLFLCVWASRYRRLDFRTCGSLTFVLQLQGRKCIGAPPIQSIVAPGSVAWAPGACGGSPLAPRTRCMCQSVNRPRDSPHPGACGQITHLGHFPAEFYKG